MSEEVTYCIHSVGSDQECEKCIALKYELELLCAKVEKMNFRLSVKFSNPPPKDTFE